MIHLIYVTVESRQKAKEMAVKLLEEKLIACANIVDELESLYHWEGKLCEAKEALLLAKTSEEKIPLAVDAIKKMHSYDLPCIVGFPVTAGLPAFLKWVSEEVR